MTQSSAEKRRVAIISGGLGGVGRAVGKQLAALGYDVIALYLDTPHEEADAIIQSFVPGNHEAVHCDVRDASAVAKTLAEVFETRGGIFACIHAAVDPIIRKNLLEFTEAELAAQLGTELFGGFNFIKTAASFMKKSGEGCIIGILSRYLITDAPHKRMAGYTVAKHALRGLLKEFFIELSSTNIRVNAIVPDFLDTKLNADLPQAIRNFIKERAVTGSIRTVEDVARAVSFLCSEKGMCVNGKIFSLDEKETTDL